MALGDIVNTTEGPVVGVDDGDGVVDDALVTGHSLSQLPVTIPVSPFRILDTRRPDQSAIVVNVTVPRPTANSHLIGGGRGGATSPVLSYRLVRRR